MTLDEQVTSVTPERLRLYRKGEGLTIAEMAERVGMSAYWLGELERGHKPITRHIALAVLADRAAKIDREHGWTVKTATAYLEAVLLKV